MPANCNYFLFCLPFSPKPRNWKNPQEIKRKKPDQRLSRFTGFALERKHCKKLQTKKSLFLFFPFLCSSDIISSPPLSVCGLERDISLRERSLFSSRERYIYRYRDIEREENIFYTNFLSFYVQVFIPTKAKVLCIIVINAKYIHIHTYIVSDNSPYFHPPAHPLLISPSITY